MPHHIEDGDNVAAGMVMLRQTVKVEVYVPEVMQVVSNVLILPNKEHRQMFIWWGMRVKNSKNGWTDDPAA